MADKPIKKAKVITPDHIRDEQRQKALQFLAQRREQFAISILSNFVKGNAFAYPKDQDKQSFFDLVDLSVEMADHLMEKLYPLKEDK